MLRIKITKKFLNTILTYFVKKYTAVYLDLRKFILQYSKYEKKII